MHLFANTLFWPSTWGQDLPKHCPVWSMHLHMSYILGDAFTGKYIIWPLNFTLASRSHKHCPVLSTSCDQCTCNNLSCCICDLGGDAFTRKYIIWPSPWGQGHSEHCPIPSTLCDLCTCKVWIKVAQWQLSSAHLLCIRKELQFIYTVV